MRLKYNETNLMKLRSFFPRLGWSSFVVLKPDRPNLITTSGDFHRGCLLTFESISLSNAELSKDWPRPNLMKEEPMLLRLSLDSVSSLRSSKSVLLTTYSNSFGDSLKILRLLSSFKTEEDTSIQLQRNAIALKAQSEIYDWKLHIGKIVAYIWSYISICFCKIHKVTRYTTLTIFKIKISLFYYLFASSSLICEKLCFLITFKIIGILIFLLKKNQLRINKKNCQN